METEEDTGIFLFKNSKTKISTETIFVEEKTTTVLPDENSKDFVGGKWMKNFLKKFLRPSLLHKPIVAVTSEEIVSESKKLPIFKDAQGDVLELAGKVRKLTKGNRRHKIKTRRQRNIKKKQQQTKQ